ncbi:MAG: AtpZ/AtpI family protein [Bacteroidota bacterium]
MNPRNQKNSLPEFARYSSLGLQMLVIIAGGVFGGYKLDKYLNFKFPVFTVVFSFLSVAFAIYYAIKDFIKKK